MQQSTKRLIVPVLVMWLASLPIFSQTIVFSRDGKTFALPLPPTSLLLKTDTLVGFTLPQAKFLLKQTFQLKECDTLRKICLAESQLKDSILIHQTLNLKDCKQINENQKNIIWMQDNQIENLKAEAVALNKAVRRQKVYKWVAILAGGAISAYTGYKYVTK